MVPPEHPSFQVWIESTSQHPAEADVAGIPSHLWGKYEAEIRGLVSHLSAGLTAGRNVPGLGI